MLLLANIDQYQECLARAVQLRTSSGLNAAEYASYRDADAKQLRTHGRNAIIEVSGPLAYKCDVWAYYMGACSYQGIQHKIKEAESSADVERIIFVMDTPGGDVVGLAETAAMIAGCSKPTVAMVDPCAASAGLWLASQAKRIVAIESGEVGSLGVMATAFSYAEMLKKAGIDVTVIRADISPDKNMAHPYEPMSAESLAYMQDRCDRKGEQFVTAVASGRGVSRDVVLAKFGKGRMLWADDAKAAGLIDEIGSLESLLAETTTVATSKRPRFKGMN